MVLSVFYFLFLIRFMMKAIRILINSKFRLSGTDKFRFSVLAESQHVLQLLTFDH